MDTPRLRGIVRTLREGYCFVQVQGQRDHFLHKSAMRNGKDAFYRLTEGAIVEFESSRDPQRPAQSCWRAEDVDILSVPGYVGHEDTAA